MASSRFFVCAFTTLVVVSCVALCSGREKTSLIYSMRSWKQCQTSSDCGVDECCVSLRNSAVRVCKKKPQLGNHCRPNIKPGSSNTCPCTMGLTCALTALDRSGKNDLYQCALVPKQEKEFEANQEL